jgi:hypothetical protein
MLGGVLRKAFLGAMFSFLVFLPIPILADAQASMKGNVIGFIYAQDGTTPLKGAVVKFKNLATGKIYDSTSSDVYGIFRVPGIESGIYTYGVIIEGGGFNAESILGLKVDERETAKLSLSVDPYDQEVAAAVSEVIKEQQKEGESLVGMVADFNPKTRMAQVQLVRGLLRLNDRIHAKGKSTDFYQEIDVLKLGNSPARRVLPGQTAALKMKQGVRKGDQVYVVPDKKIFPFFLAPLGVAVVVASNSAVTHGVLKIRDEATPVSPKR